MQTAIVYAVLILFTATLAWLLWRFQAVRRLDNRVLGERGIAAVTSVAAVLLVTGTTAALVQQAWGVAGAYALMSCWVGYWAYQRLTRLRRTR